jgi:hypothetical protein
VVFLVFQVDAAEAVFEVAGVGAEFGIAGAVGVETEVAVEAEWGLHTAVEGLGFETNGEVHTVFVGIGFHGVEAVFGGKNVVAVEAVFTFRNVIAGAIFGHSLMEGGERGFAFQRFHLCLDEGEVIGIGEIELGDFLHIFFFAERLVEEVILFLIEPHTAETIFAAVTVLAVLAFGAVLAVLAEVAAVAIDAIDAFGAPLTIHAKRHAATVTAFAGITTVVHIFAVENAEAVIAVFRLHRGVRIATIFGHDELEVVTGLRPQKILEFLYERHNGCC